MRLEYQLTANAAQLKTTLRGVEREVQASNRRMAREIAKPAFTSGKPQDAQARAREKHEKSLAAAAASLDRQRHNALMAQSRERHRTEERQARELASAKASLDRQRSRALVQLGNAREREEKRAARDASRQAASIRRGVASTAAGAVGGLVRMGGTAAALTGGFAAAGALTEQFEVKRRASQLANQAGTPQLKGTLEREALGVRGFSGTEALEGLTSFVDVTGDLTAARGLLKDMGNVALATSTNLGDLGSAMGTAFIPIADQIKDPTERLRILNSVMRATAGMGAVGAVEVKDLASEMAGLAAASARFAGGSERNLNLMVAFAQASRQRGGSSSAAEAVTSVQRFSSDILTSPAQKRLGALGVDVFTDSSQTQLKGADDILVDVLQKTKGNLVQLNEIFGERGVRAVSGFAPLFTQAEASNAKLAPGQRQAVGVAGTKAVRAELDRLLKASVTDQQIKERVGSRLEDPDMQLKEAAKVFNAAVGNELAPVATQLAHQFAALAPQIAGIAKAVGKFVAFLVENPFAGVGLIVGGAIAKDVASAGIGNMIRGEVQGKMGAALNGLGAGLTVATMIVTAGILNFEKRTANIDAGGKRVLEAEEAAARGDVDTVNRLLGEQKKATDKAKEEGFVETILKPFLSGGFFGLSSTNEQGKKLLEESRTGSPVDTERGVEVKSQEAFEQSILKLIPAAEKAAAALAKVEGPGGRGPTDPVRNTPNNKR